MSAIRYALLAAADALEGESWYLRDRLADDTDSEITAEDVIAILRATAKQFGGDR